MIYDIILPMLRIINATSLQFTAYKPFTGIYGLKALKKRTCSKTVYFFPWDQHPGRNQLSHLLLYYKVVHMLLYTKYTKDFFKYLNRIGKDYNSCEALLVSPLERATILIVPGNHCKPQMLQMSLEQKLRINLRMGIPVLLTAV